MLFDALSNAAYRLSLRGPGAELEVEGSSQQQPPHQEVENLETQYCAGLHICIPIFVIFS